jgi:L-asparaginase
MRTIVKTLSLITLLSIGAKLDAQSARIRLLATGGTIAGAQAKPGDYGYKSGAFDVQDLISAVPNLSKLAAISGEQVVNIGSQDMNDEVWLKLANRLNAVLSSADYDAAVITHGTDTLEETS